MTVVVAVSVLGCKQGVGRYRAADCSLVAGCSPVDLRIVGVVGTVADCIAVADCIVVADCIAVEDCTVVEDCIAVEDCIEFEDCIVVGEELECTAVGEELECTEKVEIGQLLWYCFVCDMI